MNLELRWTNILNTQQYQISFVSPFQLTQATCELRPAQVLALVRVSL